MTFCARDPHGDRLSLREGLHQVLRRPGLAAADVEDKPRGALDAVEIVLEVDPALEAMRGVAREAVAAGATLDRVGEEEGRLEEHVLRALVGLGGLAAHDAAEPDHARVIGDAQHLLVNLHFLLVQEQDLLALAPPAHVDGAAQLVEVVDVQRAAELEHHIVRDIDERADRALPSALEPLLHPLRRLCRRVNAANHASRKPPAAFGRADAHRMGCIVPCCNPFDTRLLERDSRQRGYFARNTENREAIGPVGRELERQHVVVRPERRARPCVARQLHEARVVIGHAELARRAQHAFAHHAANLLRRRRRERRFHPRPDVGSTTHDLELLGSRRDEAHRELVRVGVLVDAQDFPHDDSG